jgi:FdhE protein
MTDTPFARTPAEIDAAARVLRSRRPAYYEPIIDFYQTLFEIVETARTSTRITPPEIPAALLAVKRKEAMPLIDMAEFPVDQEAADTVLSRVLDLLKHRDTDTADAGARVQKAVAEGRIDTGALYSAFLADHREVQEDAAAGMEMDLQLLRFCLFWSLYPGIAETRTSLARLLESDAPREAAYCPVCGNPPLMAVLGEAGRRFLVCAFCGHSWPSRRVFCPFCTSTDGERLQYFAPAESQALRVDTCDSCGQYIKSVDARKAGRRIHPPLEQVTSVHLDFKAREAGYESGLEALDIG